MLPYIESYIFYINFNFPVYVQCSMDSSVEKSTSCAPNFLCIFDWFISPPSAYFCFVRCDERTPSFRMFCYVCNEFFAKTACTWFFRAWATRTGLRVLLQKCW